VAGVAIVVVFFFGQFLVNATSGLQETPEQHTQMPGPTETNFLSATPLLPTATSIPSTTASIPPAATSVPPTATPVPPTVTAVPPTATSVSPTATSVPPTATSVPPTATAGSAPSPTAASGLPDCPNIEWVYLPASLHRAYDITNTGSEIETITQVVTSWAGTGLIHDYKFGGTVIGTHSPPATPVPIVVEFEGELSARQLHPGQTKAFEVGIPGVSLAMTLDLVFDGTCHISASSK